MNLAELLTNEVPAYDVLKDYYLVFGNVAYAALQEAAAQRPYAQHRASPRQLTDGRFMLSADILTEIGNGGIMQDGFALLDSALFTLVEMVHRDDVLPLLPVEAEEDVEPLMVRARDELGRFIADDPATPENEAWVPAP